MLRGPRSVRLSPQPVVARFGWVVRISGVGEYEFLPREAIVRFGTMILRATGTRNELRLSPKGLAPLLVACQRGLVVQSPRAIP